MVYLSFEKYNFINYEVIEHSRMALHATLISLWRLDDEVSVLSKGKDGYENMRTW
jgi:hypothetical protein